MGIWAVPVGNMDLEKSKQLLVNKITHTVNFHSSTLKILAVISRQVIFSTF